MIELDQASFVNSIYSYILYINLINIQNLELYNLCSIPRLKILTPSNISQQLMEKTQKKG